MITILGFLLLAMGIWIIRKSGSKECNPNSYTDLYIKQLEGRVLSLQAQLSQSQAIALQAKLETKQTLERHLATLKAVNSTSVHSELDEMVLQDALNREQRCKAVIVTTLQKLNATESQIQEVLDTVDGGKT